MSVKIQSLQIENVKRVKAVELEPSPTGLTVIGGRNLQGKTSILDAIAWALGGGKRQPTSPRREGATTPPSISLTLSNGLTVERKGKTSALTVTDPKGVRSGQALLDSFVSQFALDIPTFMQASAKEKAKILLQALGVGDELARLDSAESAKFNERTVLRRVAESKERYAAELPHHKDVPLEGVSIAALVQEQQAIFEANRNNQKQRDALAALKASRATAEGGAAMLLARAEHAKENADAAAKHAEEAARLAAEESARIIRGYAIEAAGLREEAAKASAEAAVLAERIGKGDAIVSALQDADTADIDARISGAEEVNRQVAANATKRDATATAKQERAKYDAMTEEIEAVRKSRLDLLTSHPLPLPDMAIMDEELTFRGRKWDCMSDSERMQVSVATVRKLNPECGFALLDRLESMDLESMNEFGAWLEDEGLQVIATRVSTGSECTIVIEDGTIKEPTQ